MTSYYYIIIITISSISNSSDPGATHDTSTKGTVWPVPSSIIGTNDMGRSKTNSVGGCSTRQEGREQRYKLKIPSDSILAPRYSKISSILMYKNKIRAHGLNPTKVPPNGDYGWLGRGGNQI